MHQILTNPKTKAHGWQLITQSHQTDSQPNLTERGKPGTEGLKSLSNRLEAQVIIHQEYKMKAIDSPKTLSGGFF